MRTFPVFLCHVKVSLYQQSFLKENWITPEASICFILNCKYATGEETFRVKNPSLIGWMYAMASLAS